MRVRQVINTSASPLTVQLEDGSVDLAPCCGIRNVSISEAEVNRIRPHASVTLDLTEVTEHSRKTQLRD